MVTKLAPKPVVKAIRSTATPGLPVEKIVSGVRSVMLEYEEAARFEHKPVNQLYVSPDLLVEDICRAIGLSSHDIDRSLGRSE